MDKLNNLLLQLVEAIVLAPEPGNKWSFCYSRWTDPGRDTPASVRTDQYLTDLYRFRDDAHIAAWKPYKVSGDAWEVLTLIWREEVKSPNELVEALSYRGRGAEDYVRILNELIDLGWVEITDQIYQVTAVGKKLRQEAEDRTDRIFFAPWESLNKDQINDLQNLLETLKDELAQMVSRDED
jgi:predicted transcriptional regulator